MNKEELANINKAEAATMTKEELVEFLEEHHISCAEWGQGSAKTLDHLLAEINSGEATLSMEGDKVVRNISTAAITIYYSNGSKTFTLKEQMQVFADGRTRERNLDASLGEKIKIGEDPGVGARRALAEELGITEEVSLATKETVARDLTASTTFPGIFIANALYHFDVFLPESAYKEEGYTECQADKCTYFVWEEVSRENSN